MNIDADTRKACLHRVRVLSDYSSLLFHDAAKVVYKMCENDVFRRFVTSVDYQNMVHEPHTQEAISIRAKRRRTPSFAVLALEEDYSMLEEISLSFSKTPHVSDRRFHLKKYKSDFRGQDLVAWLCEAGYAKNRPAAIALGQRLWDSFYLRAAVEEGGEFEDDDRLFTFLPPLQLEPTTVQEIIQKAGGSSYVMQTQILIKGVRYNKFLCVITKEKKKFFLFRSKESTSPLLKIRLKGINFSIQQGPQSALQDSSNNQSTMQQVAAALSSPSAKTTQSMTRGQQIRREIISYFHLEGQEMRRNLTFRVDGEEQANLMQGLLVKTGAIQMTLKE